MHKWAQDLFPINRSITGQGVRSTLEYLRKVVSNLKIHSVKTGFKAFDWKVPKEWEVKDAYVQEVGGKKIINFLKNNLHLVGYSTGVNKVLNFKQLNKKLYSDKRLKHAIPYRTSYYKYDWGFCLSRNQRIKINKNKKYKVYINAKHFNGQLNYGEYFIKGKSKKEVLFSCNICHPSMANNELSGPVLTAALANYLKSKKNNLSYRFIFIPETIGAAVYLKRNLKRIRKNLIAGFVLSCVGDNKSYSLINSPYGNNYADKVAEFNYKYRKKKFKKYSFLYRGSDERQFCSPNIDLPFCSILRTKHGKYKEYHTSLDNLNFISAKGLSGSFDIMKSLIKILENDIIYNAQMKCEPFLTKYNLKRSLSGERNLDNNTKNVINLLAYSDGKRGLIEISKILNADFFKLKKIADNLVKKKLLKIKF